MTDPRQSLGQRGEALAASHLERTGYTILARNWRHALGELDLVARRGDEIVIVEVRTRRGPLQAAITAALESITPAKQARLLALTRAYLAAHDLDAFAWRVDVIAVGCTGSIFAFEVIENALDW